jgi:hypothetical protein
MTERTYYAVVFRRDNDVLLNTTGYASKQPGKNINSINSMLQVFQTAFVNLKASANTQIPTHIDVACYQFGKLIGTYTMPEVEKMLAEATELTGAEPNNPTWAGRMLLAASLRA